MLVNTSSSTLIGLSGEIVAIANHPGAVSQRRFDDRFYQLNARGIKHQNFGFIGNDFIAYRFDIQHKAS